ncbi:MAG: alpha-galactosidase [Opitutae bacterium]|nr:alpha-galactosidase [Opitutae bacterium]
MPIHALNRAWFLETPQSSYALGVTATGHLQHWHWGAKIAPTDLGQMRPVLIRSFSPIPADGPEMFSPDTMPAEFPSASGADFRSPAVEVELADGTACLDLRYQSHRLIAGKTPIEGLPSTYVEHEEEASTLQIELLDAPSQIAAILSYTAFTGHDAIARSVRIENRGTKPVRLKRVFCASIDLPEASAERWLHLAGSWARETGVNIAPLGPGCQSIASRRGVSSHQHNPFFALLGHGAKEEQGEVWGFSLVYSGNFLATVERDQFALTRAQIGINPEGFAWQLLPGASFQAPEVVLVYSAAGLGAMSRTYHRLFRTRLLRGPLRDTLRPIALNNWESTYFTFDAPTILALAQQARALGAELLMLDDGWFGKRDDDKSSLGDWTPHARKLPDGLRAMVDGVRATGVEFGLWFEPEMVSPDSELLRAHPDWTIHSAARRPSLGRNQLILDFGRAEVRDEIYRRIAAILHSAPITYLKWDMNRHLTEVASVGLPPERQGEAAHRHVLGVYAFLERLTAEFPQLCIENCAGGGGRFDPGMLAYTQLTWISDNTDAISRLSIQLGASLVYPLSVMGAHYSAVPNHQVGRVTPPATRGAVAAGCVLGIMLDPAKLATEERAELARWIERHKAWRPLLASGELHRLKDPRQGAEAAWMIVAPDQSEALVFHVRILAEPHGPFQRLRLYGLNPDWVYRDTATGESWRGDALMRHGWIFPDTGDFAAHHWHLRRAD